MQLKINVTHSGLKTIRIIATSPLVYLIHKNETTTGPYLYKITAGKFSQTWKAIFMKETKPAGTRHSICTYYFERMWIALSLLLWPGHSGRIFLCAGVANECLKKFLLNDRSQRKRKMNHFVVGLVIMVAGEVKIASYRMIGNMFDD